MQSTYIFIYIRVHVEKCIDTDEVLINNLEASQTPGDYGTSNDFAAINITGELEGSKDLDASAITGDPEPGNSLGGTDIEHTCDYYKHNAEKCGKHGNNEDGKCCSCKPAGKANFFHAINCSESVLFNVGK